MTAHVWVNNPDPDEGGLVCSACDTYRGSKASCRPCGNEERETMTALDELNAILAEVREPLPPGGDRAEIRGDLLRRLAKKAQAALDETGLA